MTAPEYLLKSCCFFYIKSLPPLSTSEEEIDQTVAQRLGVFVLLSVAAARQSPGATVAEATPISADAERPAQKRQGETSQPGAEKSTAALPKVLLSTGEKTKHYNATDLGYVSYCTVAYCHWRGMPGVYT